VCRRITGHEADAADAAQEAMIAIVRNLARFDGRSSFGTWTYRIATNASLDELRRRKRRAVPTSNDDTAEHYHASEAADPDSGQRIDAIGDHMALDAALRLLSDEYRVPVVLRDVADLDYAEIAAVLDIPVGTVKSRIARGRAALAVALSPGTDQPSGNQWTDPERPSRAP
jgi:RNA polymerase sigma-70 factor (ECF subfamily)